MFTKCKNVPTSIFILLIILLVGLKKNSWSVYSLMVCYTVYETWIVFFCRREYFYCTFKQRCKLVFELYCYSLLLSCERKQDPEDTSFANWICAEVSLRRRRVDCHLLPSGCCEQFSQDACRGCQNTPVQTQQHYLINLWGRNVINSGPMVVIQSIFVFVLSASSHRR